MAPSKQVSFKEKAEIIPDQNCDATNDLKSQPRKTRGFPFLRRAKLSLETNDVKEQKCIQHTPQKLVFGSLDKFSDFQDQLVHQFRTIKLQPLNETAESTSHSVLSEKNCGKSIEATSRSPIEFVPQFGGRRTDFSSFVDDKNQFLCLKRIDDAPKPSVRRPLGITFDETLQEWLVADTFNHRVLYVPSNKCIRRDLVKPGAVAVFEEGISFVVLDEKKVHYFTHKEDVHRVIANIVYSARGIAVTSHGHIITMQQMSSDRHSQSIVIYKATGCDEVIYHLKYECGVSPSFIHFYNGNLSVTDLSNQTVSIYRVEEDEREILNMTKINQLHRRGSNPDNGTFRFVSGVFHDRNGLRAIADADGHNLFLFNQNEPQYRISCEDKLPYISGFWVSETGIVGLCDRSLNSVRFYQLSSTPIKFPHLGGGNSR